MDKHNEDKLNETLTMFRRAMRLDNEADQRDNEEQIKAIMEDERGQELIVRVVLILLKKMRL
jgi:hypothetical protein